MARFFHIAFAWLFFTTTATAATLNDYLPKDVTYNPDIPTPKEVLGYEVGEWHVRPEQLVRYMEVLTEKSDRFSLEVTGYSHERRPLLLLTITAPENHQNIEQLRDAHLALADPQRKGDPDQAPLVLYQGYSIHGDEPSGSNAALLYAYYLAAAQGEKIEQVLKDTIILLDPSYNPDGLARFAQWANQHKSLNLVTDTQHREHVQAMPRGRVNHYWFDLNRDWLLLQHPESQARIAQFQKWKPNVLTDFHEMGTDSTFFFQPGIPTRKNPHTPEENVRLTQTLAEGHAAALDEQGRLYFTKESFDDFYAGKGSTYPDLQGAIGILFEQASSRGHAQDSINGIVEFPFTIQNQFTTSLTSMYGAHANKRWFNEYQQRFYDDAMAAAKKAGFKGYIMTDSTDPVRMNEMLHILAQHGIEAYPLTQSVKVNGTTYPAEHSYYVPLTQAQYVLIRAIFMDQTDFEDNTFYDVSAWTFPHAFNIVFDKFDGRSIPVSKTAWQAPTPQPVTLEADAYAYAFEWHHYYAPKTLNRLLQAGVHARQAMKEFTAKTTTGEVTLSPGTVVVTRAYQQQDWRDVQAILAELATEHQLPVHAIRSGMSTAGMDLGSRNLPPVKPVSVMMVVGTDANMYEAGEAWYYLDRHVGIPVSMVDTDRFNNADLSRYTHIIMVDGRYSTLNRRSVEKLQDWVQQGGVVIGQQGGARWLSEHGILGAKFVDEATFRDAFKFGELRYGDMDDFYGQRRLAGAIFEVQLDTSHPLAFGYPRTQLPVFKDSTNAMIVPDAPFVTVATYSNPEPRLAGFTAEANRQVLAGKAAIIAHRKGAGRVVAFADDVNFRAFFWGSAKLLSNAIFLAPEVRPTLSDEENAAAAAEEAAEAAHAH